VTAFGYRLAIRRRTGDWRRSECGRASEPPRCRAGNAIPAALVLAGALFAASHMDMAFADLLAPPELRLFDSWTQSEDRQETPSSPGARLGLGCGAADVFEADATPEPTAFSDCVEVDWMAGDALAPIDSDRTKYGLSRYNREVARLLKQMSAAARSEANLGAYTQGLDPEDASSESIEAAIIDAFKLGAPGDRNPVDQIDDTADQMPGAGESSSAYSPGLLGGSPAGPKPVASSAATLPEPFNTLLSIGGNIVGGLRDTGRFLQDNQWMSVCVVLALLPVGLTQIVRRRRRLR
jgi:hypothetical protein